MPAAKELSAMRDEYFEQLNETHLKTHLQTDVSAGKRGQCQIASDSTGVPATSV